MTRYYIVVNLVEHIMIQIDQLSLYIVCTIRVTGEEHL